MHNCINMQENDPLKVFSPYSCRPYTKRNINWFNIIQNWSQNGKTFTYRTLVMLWHFITFLRSSLNDLLINVYMKGLVILKTKWLYKMNKLKGTTFKLIKNVGRKERIKTIVTTNNIIEVRMSAINISMFMVFSRRFNLAGGRIGCTSGKHSFSPSVASPLSMLFELRCMLWGSTCVTAMTCVSPFSIWKVIAICSI